MFERINLLLTRASSHPVAFSLAVFIIGSLITIFRRVEAITNPQFYAEDAVFWYKEAYEADNGILPFLSPKQAYFQTISRVGGGIAMLVDIQYAPLVFNVISITITVLPVVFFLSSRFSKLIPKISHRVFLSLAYLCLPGASEVHANLTNAHWHLAILMVLVIIAPASRKVFWRIFDGAVLLLAGLSGPFVFFTLPLFAVYVYYRPSREKFALFGVLALTFCIQLYSLLFILAPGAPRSSAPLGASLVNFFTIFGGNVFLKGALGPQITNIIREFVLWKAGLLPIIVGLSGIVISGYFFYKAKIEAQIFVAFTYMVLLGSMTSPMVHLTKPQWAVMASGTGGRYYYLAILGWIFVLSYLFVIEKKTWLKVGLGSVLLFFTLVAVPKDFEVKKLRNYHFKEQVAEFHSLKKGDSYTFRIPPSWKMTLTK